MTADGGVTPAAGPAAPAAAAIQPADATQSALDPQAATQPAPAAQAIPPADPSTAAAPAQPGEEVESPRQLSRPQQKAAFKRALSEFRNNNLTTLAAALTYYAVLSVVPGLIVLISLLGLAGRHVANRVTSQVQSLAPGSSASFVHSLILQAQHHKSGAGVTAIIGLVVALWSTSSYVNSFRHASNIIYGVGEGRPIWKTVPLRLWVTLVAVVVLVVSAGIVVVSGPIADQIGNTIGAGHVAVVVWDVVKWPALLVLVSFLLAILFWASPNAKQGNIRWVTPGGVIATVLWVVVSALFAVYVTNFASYDKTYGSLAGIVIFLVWLWLTNTALLIGAEVNAELEHGRAMAAGLPENVRPFAEPRDTRKLAADDLQAAEEADAIRSEQPVAPKPPAAPRSRPADAGANDCRSAHAPLTHRLASGVVQNWSLSSFTSR